jgi:hypothetical protein
MRIQTILFFIALAVTATLQGREFSVMVYNVENLFDADGIALYDDYKPESEEDEEPTGYRPAHLLTKVLNIARLIAESTPGGPDIVALQELEWDRTPSSTVKDWAAFQKKYASQSLSEMLREPLDPEVAALPVEAFLMKALEEAGLRDYTPVLPRIRSDAWLEGDRGIAHTNALLTRFPVDDQRQHDIPGARDIHEVTLNINGAKLTIFNNHWKSGASNPKWEPLRVQAARILRARVDALLKKDPAADILLVGDFNSHHNQHLVMPGETTGIHHVLGSGESEKDLLAGRRDLYNLWYEKPSAQRGSEVWRGKWGTLMQIIVTRGLYDRRGVSYIDNSFRRVAIDNLNYDPLADEPIRWHFYGNGGGFSDHLPVLARFVVETSLKTETMLELTNPSHGRETVANPPIVDLSRIARAEHPAHTTLANASEDDLAQNMGRFFRVESKLLSAQPPALAIGKRIFRIFSFQPEVREAFADGRFGDPVAFTGQLGYYRGDLQFVIPDARFLQQPSID